ncbi:hypothetical protein Q4595_17050, partial [Wenyingzhuangia sp. 1_MG-2023]|nr:hypothetical protein [Wenyingzhuangia sp. 1_MG-2023]
IPFHSTSRMPPGWRRYWICFPVCRESDYWQTLVQAALNDLTSGFPYVAGNTIVARDEEGFPLYEDIGPTPTFLALSRKHLARMDPGQH